MTMKNGIMHVLLYLIEKHGNVINKFSLDSIVLHE